MNHHANYCPFCGTAFETRADVPDSRSPAGYLCDACGEVLEIQVNRFPLA